MKWYTLEERIPKKGESGQFKLKDGTDIGYAVIDEDNDIIKQQMCWCCCEIYKLDEIESWAPYGQDKE